MKKVLAPISIILLLLLFSSMGFAQAIQWTQGENANGHWYEVFISETKISWDEAIVIAQGLSGNLASITSAAENAFVYSLVDDFTWSGSYGPWIGGTGYFDADSSSWIMSWSDGEVWDYENWDENQPNGIAQTPVDGQQTLCSLLPKWG